MYKLIKALKNPSNYEINKARYELMTEMKEMNEVLMNCPEVSVAWETYIRSGKGLIYTLCMMMSVLYKTNKQLREDNRISETTTRILYKRF